MDGRKQEKHREQRHFTHFSRVDEDTPEPFESYFTDGSWSASDIPRPHVERAAESHYQTGGGEFGSVCGDPSLLQRRTEANEDDIGRGVAYHVRDSVVLPAVLGEISVVCTRDLEGGETVGQLLGGALGDPDLSAEQKYRQTVAGGKGEDIHGGVDARGTRVNLRGVCRESQRHAEAVGQEQIGVVEQAVISF